MIDFGVAGPGDPACDIAVQLGNYGDGVVQRMATHHPRLLDVIDRARFWAGTFELQWAPAGLEHGRRLAAAGSHRQKPGRGTGRLLTLIVR